MNDTGDREEIHEAFADLADALATPGRDLPGIALKEGLRRRFRNRVLASVAGVVALALVAAGIALIALPRFTESSDIAAPPASMTAAPAGSCGRLPSPTSNPGGNQPTAVVSIDYPTRVSAGSVLHATISVQIANGNVTPSPTIGGGWLILVQQGHIVAVTEDPQPQPASGSRESWFEQVEELTLNRCGTDAGTRAAPDARRPLPPGSYELYVALELRSETDTAAPAHRVLSGPYRVTLY